MSTTLDYSLAFWRKFSLILCAFIVLLSACVQAQDALALEKDEATKPFHINLGAQTVDYFPENAAEQEQLRQDLLALFEDSAAQPAMKREAPIMIYTNFHSQDVILKDFDLQVVSPDLTLNMSPFDLLDLPQVRDFNDWCLWASALSTDNYDDLPPIWLTVTQPSSVDVEDCVQDYGELDLAERPFILWPIGTRQGIISQTPVWLAFDRKMLRNEETRLYLHWMIHGDKAFERLKGQEYSQERYNGSIAFYDHD